MAELVSQYEDFPTEPNPGLGSDSSDQGGENNEESKNITKIVYVAIGVVVLVIIYLAFFSGGGHSTDVGSSGSGDNSVQSPGGNDDSSASALEDLSKNGLCDPGENCFDNPGECRCRSGEYCANETKNCTAPVCGNGKCEPLEYADTCCDDCSCAHNDCRVCDNSTHACKAPDANISDDAAMEAVTKYYGDKDILVDNVTVKGSVCVNSSSAKYVVAEISRSKSEELRVTESGEVISYPKL